MRTTVCKLILISAPVGYGKTTLLADWNASEQESRLVTWVSLDSDDRDPARFWAYILEALNRVRPGFCEDLQTMLCKPEADLEGVVMPRFINELSTLPRQVVIT
jgi:LuxR family maltose regulon positive regulatory protein